MRKRCEVADAQGRLAGIRSADSLQRPTNAAEPTQHGEWCGCNQPVVERGQDGHRDSQLELDGTRVQGSAEEVKTRIGSGGTAKDGVIELQGDQVELALELLTKGMKRAGG